MKWFKKRRFYFYREGPAWVEKIRLFISTKLLDMAESLPEVKAGALHHLQYLRGHQREQAEKNFEKYQIPEGTVINLLGFQLVELFHIEDFENLQQSLKSLFSDSYELHKRDFDKFHGKISFGNGYNQGYLVPQGSKDYLYMDDRAEVEHLSDEISSIKLSTYQVIPSIVALIIEVYLTEEAQINFVELFDRKYMYPLKIQWRCGSKMPLPSGTGYLHSGAEIEFKKWSESLQINTEKCMRDYFPGYFSSENSEKLKLPRIDIFVIDESNTNKSEIEDSPQEEGHYLPRWKQCLGLNNYFSFINTKDKTQWSFNDNLRNVSWPTRIIVNKPSFIKGKNMAGYFSENFYIWNQAIEWLREIMIPYSLAEYFQIELEKLLNNRRLIFQLSAARKRLSLKKVFKLVAESESSSIVLDRVLMELDLVEKSSSEQLNRYTKSFENQNNENWTLADAFSRKIEYNKELLTSQSNFLENTTSQIINFVNLRATRRLTLFSIIISILSLLIAIIALNLDWASVKDMISSIFN